MKSITKILICFLALCLLLPCIASCKKKGGSGHHQKPPAGDDSQQTTPVGGGSDHVGDPEVTTDPDADIVMPELVDMGGYTYRAYVRDHAGDTLEEQLQHGNNFYKLHRR